MLCLFSSKLFLYLFTVLKSFSYNELWVCTKIWIGYIQKTHLWISLNLLNTLRTFQIFFVMGNSTYFLCTCQLHIICDFIYSHQIFPQSAPFLDGWIPVHSVYLPWETFKCFWPYLTIHVTFFHTFPMLGISSLKGQSQNCTFSMWTNGE